MTGPIRCGPSVDPELAEDVDLWLESIDQFAAASIDTRRIDTEHRIGPEILAGLAELGAFGASIPDTYGGLGLPLGACAALVATLARHDRSVATAVGLHVGLGTRGLIAFGSDELKQRFLPDMASGERIGAFATTEPAAGSDLQAIQTRLRPDGDALSLTGSKIFVTNGGFADVLTIVASSPGLGGVARGHSVVVLDAKSPGVIVGAEEDKLGIRGSSTTSLYFDETPCSIDQVLGQAGRGMDHTSHILSWGRTAMAAGCYGAAIGARDAARTHTAQRSQFGTTLDHIPVVAARLEAMDAQLFAMRAVLERTLICEGEPLALWSTVAKVFVSEGNWQIADMGLQLHGGSGFIEEGPAALFLRDARVPRIFEGANDVLLTHLGAMSMAQGKKNRAALEAEPSRGQTALGLRAVARAAIDHGEGLLDTYGFRVLRDPLSLHRHGELALLGYAATAVLAYLRTGHDADADRLAALWLDQARAQLRALTPEQTATAPALELTA